MTLNAAEQSMPRSTSDDGPALEGIRVIELAMYVQGPIAGLALGSLGADVVKIEQVGQADVMRSLHSAFGVTFDERGQEWVYASLNRNKRSIALDLLSESARPVFERMIREADVFITNLRASALDRYGAGPDTLMEINPRLVYCRGGGFGFTGELAQDVCQDTVGMAYAGFMDSIAPTEEPTYPPGALSDVLTGTHMASAVLAGLVKRSITGKGYVVGTSQTQSLLWLQSQAVGVAANLGTRLERFSPAETTNPLFTIYETSDGWIAVATLHPQQWPALAEAAGLDHLLEDPLFADIDAVRENRSEFRAIAVPHFRKHSTDHWFRTLRGCGAWVAPVNRLEDLANDPGILENEYLVTFDDGFVGPPTPFDVGDHRGVRGATASYGEHTDEVLAELGYTEDELLQLRIDNAIW